MYLFLPTRFRRMRKVMFLHLVSPFTGEGGGHVPDSCPYPVVHPYPPPHPLPAPIKFPVPTGLVLEECYTAVRTPLAVMQDDFFVNWTNFSENYWLRRFAVKYEVNSWYSYCFSECTLETSTSFDMQIGV